MALFINRLHTPRTALALQIPETHFVTPDLELNSRGSSLTRCKLPSQSMRSLILVSEYEPQVN